MNSGPLLFLGIFATLASSFWGILLVPQLQLGRQQQVTNPVTSALYPATRGGSAKQGAEVYRSLGCAECHSQQVRGLGADIDRKWGDRISVAQDYLGDYPVLLGAQRIGPDLANFGSRQTNADVILTHLYDPRSSQPGSTMPPYQFLFDRRKLKPGEASSVNLANTGDSGSGVVALPEAVALADYLLSLRLDTPLYEAPFPGAATNKIATVSTNAPGTNVVSTNASATSNVPPTTPSK